MIVSVVVENDRITDKIISRGTESLLSLDWSTISTMNLCNMSPCATTRFFVPSHHTGRMRHSLSRDFSYPCQCKRAYKIFEKCLNQICYFCGWKQRMHEWYFLFGCGCYLVPLHVQSYHVQAYDGFHRHFALVYHTDLYDEFHLHFDLVYLTDHTVATHGLLYNFYH